MVARGPDNKATQVSKLQPQSEEEIKLFQEGESMLFTLSKIFISQEMHNGENCKLRFLWIQCLQQVHFPSSNKSLDEERQLLHELFMSARKQKLTQKFPNSQYEYMSNTQFQSTTLMQPQERNIHGKVINQFSH